MHRAARAKPSNSWGCSSAGRAHRSQRGGRRFESAHLHHCFWARPSATRSCEPRQDRKVAAVSNPSGVPLITLALQKLGPRCEGNAWHARRHRRGSGDPTHRMRFTTVGPMAHRALTLKYRPQVFADMVGQDHVTRVLERALESGRIAHAYLFTGARGVGKTTTARIL